MSLDDSKKTIAEQILEKLKLGNRGILKITLLGDSPRKGRRGEISNILNFEILIPDPPDIAA